MYFRRTKLLFYLLFIWITIQLNYGYTQEDCYTLCDSLKNLSKPTPIDLTVITEILSECENDMNAFCLGMS